jgi:hypothetical protein
MEYDILIFDVDQALEDLDYDAEVLLQHIGTITYDLPQHNDMLCELELDLLVTSSEIYELGVGLLALFVIHAGVTNAIENLIWNTFFFQAQPDDEDDELLKL